MSDAQTNRVVKCKFLVAGHRRPFARNEGRRSQTGVKISQYVKTPV